MGQVDNQKVNLKLNSKFDQIHSLVQTLDDDEDFLGAESTPLQSKEQLKHMLGKQLGKNVSFK